MQQQYTYQAAMAASEGARWKVEDIIGGDKRLDFTKPFMPESLARVSQLSFLTPDEKRTLNQITRTHLPVHLRPRRRVHPAVRAGPRTAAATASDDYRTRALLQFAGEEAKHIHLFKRFREEFEAGFGTPCAVIGPPEAIAEGRSGARPAGGRSRDSAHRVDVAASLHREHQGRSASSTRSSRACSRHHWMEEAQHAKLDTLMVEALAEGRSSEEIEAAVEGYIEIGGFLDAGLAQQVEFDMEAFYARHRSTRCLTARRKSSGVCNGRRTAGRTSAQA